MSPWWACVHLSSCYRAIPSSFFHLLLNALISIYEMFTHPLNIYPQSFMLSNFMSFRWSFCDRYEQILNFLVVNLHHWDLNFILFIRLSIISNTGKNLLATNRYNSFVTAISNHRIRLSWSCLSISKEATVIALPSIIQDLYAYLFEYLSLISIFIRSRYEIARLVSLEPIVRPERIVERIIANLSAFWILSIE